ncbi:MAG: guanylate kinase [Bacteroidales bacterium]|nr:guanylate kinase [Bacteroidales bacterium]MCL2133511.1 guanylate kinase [Bacteroidales bacterium]
MNKVIIFSAPSGSGKTTLVRHALQKFPQLEFSVSATNRAPRGEEKNGRDYFFLTPEEFELRVNRGDFVEWEEVYSGLCYGTLSSEVERIWSEGKVIAFDIDVCGGVNLKRLYGKQALSIFVSPPSIEVLRQRLESRGTDTSEAIQRRLGKAEEELAFAAQFDRVIVNDKLEQAKAEVDMIITDFLNNNKAETA